ncbi:MAG: LysM peptidoglycan-binding domain-containing protein [Acidimicrobiia bacterium]
MQKATLQLSVRLCLLLATICIVFLMIGGSADAEGPPPPVVEYVVAPGDTLWGIAAARTDSGGDIRRLVSDIIELSGVESEMIIPGQILLLPGG